MQTIPAINQKVIYMKKEYLVVKVNLGGKCNLKEINTTKKIKNVDISEISEIKEKEKNPNFKKEVFEKKVSDYIESGYTRELAEWQVLGDFNNKFLGFLGKKPNKRLTDSEGFYM